MLKNKPELRFTEFDSEWQNMTLDNQFFNRKEPGNPILPIYSVTLDRGMVPRDSLDRNIGNDAASDDNLLVKQNDLAYNMMRLWQGAIGWAEQNCMISPAYVVLGPYDSVCSVFFIYLFERSRSLYLFTINSQGITSDRLRLYYKDFSKIKFPTPSYPEQQKIASFLTSVDQKLTQLKKKKSLLEQYKAGVMRQIFSQEIRFKDDEGKEFPKWEGKSLEDISEKIMYGMNSSAVPFDGVNKYLRITDIDDSSRKFAPKPLSSPSDLAEYQYILKEGDIVFTRTGASVGKSYLYDKNDGKLLFAGFLIKFSIVNQNPYFVFCQTLTDSYKNWIQKMSMRSGQPGINAEEYKSLNFSIPCLSEQVKIANFLSSLDIKINNCANNISKMEQWKKGLLQRMFC
jgi:type I restriction enzyme S subunit